MAETDTNSNQSAGSASRLSAMRLRLKSIDKNKWTPIIIVALIFVLALFLRSYFAYDESASNGWLVSGGSDSYYYQRLMQTGAETGEHLHWDEMLNFPTGARNPRPPLYTFSVAVPAAFFSGFFPSLDDSIGFFLIWSTAIWGALTIIPTYYIGRDIFSRRVGYLAALFLAILPAHVERSVATLADHDSFALFFIVLTIFFLMKSLKVSNNSKWIEDWGSAKSIFSGLRGFASQNKKAILFALLAGLSFSSVAVAWVGYAYVEVIMLAFFLILILINKFKGVDSTTVTLLFFIAFSFAFLLAFPVYWQMDIFATRFDVPVYLFLGAILVGFLFTISRDYPWLLVLPTLMLILALGVFAITVISPAIGEAIITGQGYFATSKLYDTIAEAKAPIFSNLAVSFGIVTFFLSLIGLILMLLKIPKRVSGDYIVISVWLPIAIFMAASAGRFMFNAAPAFAISSAWVALLIVDRLEFRKVGKLLLASSGNILQVLKKSIKIRHIIGALFIVFMLIMPNLWSSLDAGIPSENKRAMDTDIYNSMPDFLKPADYTAGSSLWYLGSFGYSLPMPTQYFPAMWKWFANQDADILPYSDRPAYVSWWDYGFEAIQAGKHPTVADNFQQGYEIAGNILLSTSEEETIGLMISRVLISSISDRAFPDDVSQVLEKYNVSSEKIMDVYSNTSNYKSILLSNQARYGSVTSDISKTNILWRYLGMYFADLGLEKEVALYKDLKEATGNSIGYISADARLMVISATSVGVFYAPAKLTDRPFDVDGNPLDYYEIKAVDENGVEYALSELSGLTDVNIVDYKLNYKETFFETMLYKTMGGIAPSDLGKANDGLPGLSGSVQDVPALPGWNLTHFVMFYRTAYYNPASDGTGTWTAIDYDTAAEYKQKIDAKEMEGVVDLSPSVMYQAGAVILKYYDGAVLTGKVTTKEGDPAPGIRITVQDKYGIPHQTVVSSGDGSYSVILPPGNVTVQISNGDLDAKTLIGTSKISSIGLEVTDDMASRKSVDSDGDGRVDWQLERDFTVAGGTLSGHVFWDMNSDGNYTETTDVLIKNSTIIATNLNNLNYSYQFVATDGEFEGLITTGTYQIDTIVNGIQTNAESTLTMQPGQLYVRDIARASATISGTVTYEDGQIATGATVRIIAQDTDIYPVYGEVTTDSDGTYSFEHITPGGYMLSASIESGTGFISISYETSVRTTDAQLTQSANLVLKPAGFLTVKAYDSDGDPVINGTVKIANAYSPSSETTLVKLNESGRGEFLLPEGTYSLTIRMPTGSGIEIGGTEAFLPRFGSASVTINLASSARITGEISGIETDEIATIALMDGFTTYLTSTDSSGIFSIYVPPGDYKAVFFSAGRMATQTVHAPSSDLSILLEDGIRITGSIWHDHNGNGIRDSFENITFARINAELENGITLRSQTDINGKYSLYVPKYTTLSLTADAIGYLASNPQTVNTGGVDLTRNIRLEFSPIKIDGVLTDGEIALWSATIQFINSSVSYTFVSGSGGLFSGEILPGIYEVKMASPVANNSLAVYYHSSHIAAFVGTDISGLTVTSERRIRIEGTITGISSSRYARINFDGPSQQVVEARGGYETYLAEGDYSLYAYDRDGGLFAVMSTFTASLDSNVLDINLQPALEISGRVRIGSRSGNITQISVTSDASGATTSKTISAGASYSFVLPAGTYDFSFQMKVFEDLGRSKRFYLLHNESTVNLQSKMQYEPFLRTSLDNSTLFISMKDESGNPVQARVMLGSMDEYAIDADFETDVNGISNSSVHPGDYAVYIADTITGLSYIGQLVVSHEVPAILNLTLTEGFLTTVIATANGVSDIEYLSLKITSVSSSAFIRILNGDVNNTAVLMLPEGEYVIYGETSRIELEKLITYSATVQTKISSNAIIGLALTKSVTYSFDASWSETERQSILPGESVTYHITIVNTGTAADSYTLGGIGAGFDYEVPEDPVQIGYEPSDNSAVVAVTITAKTEAKVEHGDVYIDVKSVANSNARESVAVEIDILPVYLVNASQADTGSTNATVYFAVIEVRNDGNVKDNYTVRIANANELSINGWNVEFQETGSLETKTKNIDSGSFTTINITLTANREKPNGNISVAVLVLSNTSPTTSTLATVSPILPELEFAPDGITVTGDDIYFEDIFAQRDLENISLLLVLLVMTGAIFIVRKIKFGRFFR